MVVDSVKFSFYTDKEIREISVKEITKSELLDAKNTAVPGGLYDPALGPINDIDSCKTCGQLSVRCPGHCGHIELARPLYHPLLFNNLKNLLQITCFYCHRFRLITEKVQRYVSQLELISRGDVIGARNLDDMSFGELLFPEEQKPSSLAVCTDGSFISPQKSKQRKWTSLQYTEAMNLLSKFFREKRKKCANCKRSNPKITSPSFGWLKKAVHGSDIRANLIQGSNLGLASIEGVPDTFVVGEGAQAAEDLQSSGDVSSPTIEELFVPAKAPKHHDKGLKDLPPDFGKEKLSTGQHHLLPSEVEYILKALWANEARLCMFICDLQQESVGSLRTEETYTMFLLKALVVPPSKFRPAAQSTNDRMLEHPQNILLSKVQEANNSLRIANNHDQSDIVQRWMNLQRAANVLFDSSKGLGKSDREATGIRQLLEKKSGILRQKMMGKRVNFACRSVISPDPYLAVNEIGVPPHFALKLTYPERVTPWNVNKMRNAILNGSDIHPGATHYKDEERMCRLPFSRNKRSAISRKLHTSRAPTQLGRDPESKFEGKVVYRHLQDGDVVLVNRQPTLHKPSMMAHIVRVLKGEMTLRMHYANCRAYNADFDGDEMNVHLPQDEISRAEAINIVNANKQYAVPTSGEPIRGLIQDHIVSAVLLTKKDTFLTREEYHQLLYASCVPASAPSCQLGRMGQRFSLLDSGDEILPLPPAILKPTPLWTGKQVISAILSHVTRNQEPFTVEKDARIPKDYLGKDPREFKLHIYKNDFIHGMIDKAQFGPYGLVHTVHELYGADTAGVLLSIFSRLFTVFLQLHGFTCGVDDLLIAEESDLERERILGEVEVLSEDVHYRFTATEDCDIDPVNLNSEVEKVIRTNGESAILRLDSMMSKILSPLADEVNNAIFPDGLLKPFPSNCLSLMTTTGAKGELANFVQISSLLGQQELEGKRVPRMVSGKTLPCFPPWDISSRAGGFISDRFLTGLRPQEYFFHCMAGRDGLVDTAIKTSRSGYLQRCLVKNLESLRVCYDLTVRDADGSVVQFMYGEDGVDVLKSSFLSEINALATNHKVMLKRLSSHVEEADLSRSNGFVKKLPSKLEEKAIAFVDGILKNLHSHHDQIKRKDVRKLMKHKYLSSLAEPGEPVGVIAAQSVGEPATQMTLNTFHHAGKGEMNVTLGVPRLQEIMMSAKENIRTPVMTCPLLGGRNEEHAKCLVAKIRRVSVAQIIESMEVRTDPFPILENPGSTIYKLKMKLRIPDLYHQQPDLSPEACEKILTVTFVGALDDAISRHLEMISKIMGVKEISAKEDISFTEPTDEDESQDRSTKREGNDDDSGDDNEGDQGFDAEKRKRQISDELEYEDDIEKERPDIAYEQDGEPSSEFESEIDQAEPDDDYTMGAGPPTSEAEVEPSEGPSKIQRSESGSKKQKQEVKSKTKLLEKKKKKDLRVIKVDYTEGNFEVHFLFRNEPHILLAEIAQKTANKVFLKGTKNIEQCCVIRPKDQPLSLQTAGVNFLAFWDLHDSLDVTRIVTNDIHAMLKTYGVEAARATIVKEVMGVFAAYGGRVNIRHLSLIADFMTAHGGIRPMNRLGMDLYGTSPFSKMTFETASKFIIEAAVHGEVDTLESPSASVCLGQPVKMGTGCFGLMHNLQL